MIKDKYNKIQFAIIIVFFFKMNSNYLNYCLHDRFLKKT
jgi:hypothetical protein